MVISYVFKRFEDGAWTGVPRFDFMLRRVFPGMKSLTVLPDLDVSDIVITDNHLSLDVPAQRRKVIVFHGCAKTHFDRDPSWRTERTAVIVEAQHEMFLNGIDDETFPIAVAPGSWVEGEFREKVAPDWIVDVNLIPHWVDRIPSLKKAGKPKIIGDWRDWNKGAAVWRRIAAKCPQWEFQPLNFRDDAGRRRQYGEASLYLCLSLSEGGPYSVCDAEAAELPIVTTDVGNYREFDDAEVIPWQDRDNIDLVIAAIGRKLIAGRRKPSFYENYSFDAWAGLWRELVG